MKAASRAHLLLEEPASPTEAVYSLHPGRYAEQAPGFFIDAGPQQQVALVAFSRVRDKLRRFTWQLTEEAARRSRVVEELGAACQLGDIALLLEEEGHDASAARVRHLLNLAAEEKDDGEKEPQTESLRSLARFLLLENPALPRPILALGPLGLFTAEWNADPSGGMVLQFVSDDEIQFTGVANIRESDPPYQEMSCTLNRAKALEALSVFAKDPQIEFCGADPLL